MTTVRLRGGLGNQMFQYATGFVAADLAGQDLVLDVSAFNKQPLRDTPRRFELSEFRISHTRCMDGRAISWFMRRVRNKLFVEDPYRFYPEALSRRVLDGYFQNEKYFVSRRNALLNEFVLRETRSSYTEIRQSLRGIQSLSLHVRRGDYVSNAHASSHHGLLGREYFSRAYEYVVSMAGRDFKLFVFSDDAEWAREHIDFHPNIEIVSDRGCTGAEELCLMSQCTHNIISNSSFSWWAGWLNANPGKIVVGPGMWTVGRASTEIMPTAWKRIS